MMPFKFSGDKLAMPPLVKLYSSEISKADEFLIG